MAKNLKTREALETAAVAYLRSPNAGDEQEWIALNRASISFYRGLASPMLTATEFASYLDRCQRDDYIGLLICRKPDDAIVGSINLSQIFRGGFQNAYLGYQVGAPFAGQGYMTEALQLMLNYAYDTLKLHRLEANIQPGNRASIALVRRAGFIKEGFSRRYLKICGRWRDHERWAILAEDWRGLKRSPARVSR
jgi:ribosomal-protein-alanine N-acetyltransferase